MIYTFKRGVANDFSFSENLVPPHAYFVPFSSKAVFREGNGPTQRYFSDRVKSLSGEWDFCCIPDGDVEKRFDSAECTEKITVPGSVESFGYFVSVGNNGFDYTFRKKIPDGKKSSNSLFIYRKTFLISDSGKKYTVLFTDVRGRFDVYVNGVYCGFSSLGTGEFDLTPYLISGENELLVAVKRWSVCSYYTRDFTDSAGIVGEVLLYSKNKNALFDYDLYCKEDNGVFNGKFTFFFDCDNTGARAEINLSLRGREIFCTRTDILPAPIEIEFSDSFLPYTSETPDLYDLCVRVIENGKITEYVNQKVGFTSLDEMGGTVFFCTRPLKIRAIDYNATSSKFGETMTFSDYEKDFELIKKYGFNAIKTFALDPAVIEAARDVGLYVILRSGINTEGEATFGEKKKNTVTDDKRFERAFVDKTAYLYARFRNDPSVLFYDFGRESADSANLSACLRYILGKGQKLIVCADSAVGKALYDPTVDELLDEINLVGAQRPIFLSSYACSEGLGSGFLADFDEILDSTPCCFGGCVRRFVDETVDGVCVRDEGMFTSKREPYPAAKLHRYLARPIKVRVVGADRIEVTNLSYFTRSSDKTLLLQVLVDGKVEQRAKLSLDLPPRTAREMDFFMGATVGDKHLNVTCLDREGREISSEQLVVATRVRPFAVTKGRKIAVFEKGDSVEIAFDCGMVVFSKSAGSLTCYDLLGTDVLRAAPDKRVKGCFDTKIDRPFVRNILNGRYDGTECVTEDFSYIVRDNLVEVRAKSRLFVFDKPAFLVEDEYVVYAGGAIYVHSALKPLKKCPKNIDCFAKSLRFNRAFNRVTYYGRGEDDNYVDCNAHTRYGIYETTADKMSSGTPFGQERGNRTDVHYTVVRNRDGMGLLLSAERVPYQLRVSTLSDGELAQGYLTRTEPAPSGVYVDVAAMVSGYGAGILEPMPKYRMTSVEHTLEFKIVPLKPAEKDR